MGVWQASGVVALTVVNIGKDLGSQVFLKIQKGTTCLLNIHQHEDGIH